MGLVSTDASVLLGAGGVLKADSGALWVGCGERVEAGWNLQIVERLLKSVVEEDATAYGTLVCTDIIEA